MWIWKSREGHGLVKVSSFLVGFALGFFPKESAFIY
jgi:hypothetical protein